MEITHFELKVDTKSIDTTLTCDVILEFDRNIEVPISISGHLRHGDGRLLSLMNEDHTNEKSFGLRLLFKEQKEELQKQNRKDIYHALMYARLTKKALESIENERNKTSDKSANFQLKFIIKSLGLHNTTDLENNDFVKVKVDRKYKNIRVEQSDWVNNFAEKLGIGKYMLIELNVPKRKIPDFWSNLFEKMQSNIDKMETSIRSGDWEKTLFIARKFSENIKIGDNQKGHKDFKEAFSEKMKIKQHSEEGIQNLYDAIYKFFSFLSKFSHEKDRQGNCYDKLPIPTKEDAYFAYALSIALMGLMGKKIDDQ